MVLSCDLATPPLRSTGRSRSTCWAPPQNRWPSFILDAFQWLWDDPLQTEDLLKTIVLNLGLLIVTISRMFSFLFAPDFLSRTRCIALACCVVLRHPTKTEAITVLSDGDRSPQPRRSRSRSQTTLTHWRARKGAWSCFPKGKVAKIPKINKYKNPKRWINYFFLLFIYIFFINHDLTCSMVKLTSHLQHTKCAYISVTYLTSLCLFWWQ